MSEHSAQQALASPDKRRPDPVYPANSPSSRLWPSAYTAYVSPGGVGDGVGHGRGTLWDDALGRLAGLTYTWCEGER